MRAYQRGHEHFTRIRKGLRCEGFEVVGEILNTGNGSDGSNFPAFLCEHGLWNTKQRKNEFRSKVCWRWLCHCYLDSHVGVGTFLFLSFFFKLQIHATQQDAITFGDWSPHKFQKGVNKEKKHTGMFRLSSCCIIHAFSFSRKSMLHY